MGPTGPGSQHHPSLRATCLVRKAEKKPTPASSHPFTRRAWSHVEPGKRLRTGQRGKPGLDATGLGAGLTYTEGPQLQSLTYCGPLAQPRHKTPGLRPSFGRCVKTPNRLLRAYTFILQDHPSSNKRLVLINTFWNR